MKKINQFLFVSLFSFFFSCNESGFDPSTSIENGDFSDGTKNWEIKTEGEGAANMKIENGALLITISSITENDWDVRLGYTKGLILEANTRYRLGFNITSSGEDKQVRADFNGKENGDFTHFSDFSPAYANSYKSEVFKTFVMNSSNDEVDLDFFIGDDDNDLLIDNIILEKKEMPESEVSGEWTIQSFDADGKKTSRYSVDFTMEPDGTLKRKVDNYFFSGYVSGNQVEALLYSKFYFNGTVNQTNDTITGVFKNFEQGYTGTFYGVNGVIYEDIAGAYDLYANYSTPYVSVQNEKDIITITQDGETLGIAGKSDVTGEIDGVDITLSGDILPGEGSGGSQVFEGSVSGNSISGTISGNVVQKDAGNNVFIQYISIGDFTLIRRDN